MKTFARWGSLSKWSLAALLALCAAPAPAAGSDVREAPTPNAIRYKTLAVEQQSIFYREAGPPDAPVVLLLHGFPTSSFMFRDLIPKLSDRFRVIAPDFPGFGQSSAPDRRAFSYTFDDIARVMTAFVDALRLERYALYVQDYGAPVGFRLALARPERVAALIVQNGNAYVEGLDPTGWAPLRDYWREPTQANRDRLRVWLTPEGVRQQYLGGVESQAENFSPDTWTLDWARLSRPGNIEIQLDLFANYADNVALYPRFQEMFRSLQPPTLIVWGKHDPFFTQRGAEAYRRDLPQAELVWLDAGHFALETHAEIIARHLREFLAKHLRPRGSGARSPATMPGKPMSRSATSG